MFWNIRVCHDGLHQGGIGRRQDSRRQERHRKAGPRGQPKGNRRSQCDCQGHAHHQHPGWQGPIHPQPADTNMAGIRKKHQNKGHLCQQDLAFMDCFGWQGCMQRDAEQKPKSGEKQRQGQHCSRKALRKQRIDRTGGNNSQHFKQRCLPPGAALQNVAAARPASVRYRRCRTGLPDCGHNSSETVYQRP